eukprot:3941910-Rhodomonas_salina.1
MPQKDCGKLPEPGGARTSYGVGGLSCRVAVRSQGATSCRFLCLCQPREMPLEYQIDIGSDWLALQ